MNAQKQRKQGPLASMLERQGFVVIDGGLATELEARGHDLDHPLWSARLLLEQPQAIKDVHLSYLQAGADCFSTATYQASMPGLLAEGLAEPEAKSVLQQAVTLACEARDEFLAKLNHSSRLRPVVAASIGPYGAYLADGSEYRGNYGVSKAALRDFHKPRWQILAQSQADVLACETIPSLPETEVLRELFEQTPARSGWVSFSCHDGRHINDGTPLTEAAALFADCDNVTAVGVNCTAPRHISSLIAEIRQAAPGKDIAVYPNSGEAYDVSERKWLGTSEPLDFGRAASQWFSDGARLIGGCCRTGPEHVRAIREALAGGGGG